MTPEQLKEIKAQSANIVYHCSHDLDCSKAACHLPDCLDEIERLQGCLQRISDRQLGDPEEYWEMARKALENNQGTKPVT